MSKKNDHLYSFPAGIKVKAGVVLAVEKKLSSVLVDETSFKKI